MLINAQISNILDNLNFLTNCSIILSGAHMRRASAELAERRRASFGSKGEIAKSSMKSGILIIIYVPVGLRADGTLDPHHAAILFRDSRGVSFLNCLREWFERNLLCSIH